MINVILWAAGIVLRRPRRVADPAAVRRACGARPAGRERASATNRGAAVAARRAGDETTGADEMRELLRRQVYVWAARGILGVVPCSSPVSPSTDQRMAWMRWCSMRVQRSMTIGIPAA